jgi:hypothetical protein
MKMTVRIYSQRIVTDSYRTREPPSLQADRWDADAHGIRIQGVGAEAGPLERLDHGGNIVFVERSNEDAPTLLLDDPRRRIGTEFPRQSARTGSMNPGLMWPVRTHASCSAR